MKKKILAVAVCALMLSLSACGNDTESSSASDTTTTTAEITTAPIVESVPVNLDEGPTDAMMERAIINQGNTSRLQALINKAKDAEYITVAYIGGSITQGSSAQSSSNNYVNQTSSWIESNFGCMVRTVNAGIGATDSYIGVHRVERDVIAENPDLVIVEFSVNDTNETRNRQSYASLLYKLMTSESQPAVMCVIMTQEDGTSLSDVHTEVAKAYELPIISYREAVLPEIQAGNLLWTDISPDNIHPNDKGHVFLSQLIQNYLKSVIDSTDSSVTEAEPFTIEALYTDKYGDAEMGNRDSERITVVDAGGFTEDVSFQKFYNGWGARTAGSTITFEIEAKNIGVIYKRTVDGLTAQAAVYVDGELVATLDGDFSGGWGNYAESTEIYAGDETSVHTVEVKMIGETKENFEVLNWLIS